LQNIGDATALSIAAFNGELEVVKMLVEAGANLELKVHKIRSQSNRF
jgi:ankyrin repeat protein